MFGWATGGLIVLRAIVGLFFILGVGAAPFLPGDQGQPLPETLAPALPVGALPTS